MTFPEITPAHMDAIAARAEKETGIPISGTHGVASRSGVTVEWMYNPLLEILNVTITKPWYIPASMVTKQLCNLVDSTRSL